MHYRSLWWVLPWMALSAQAASDFTESTQSLGVMNGTLTGNQWVTLRQNLPNPTLFSHRVESAAPVPTSLRIRRAQLRAQTDHALTLRLSRPREDGLPGNQIMEMVVYLQVDGQRSALKAQAQGEDIAIALPPVKQWVELRSDTPITLQVPKGLRGELVVAMDIEAWSGVP